jgi:hypothetical protein
MRATPNGVSARGYPGVQTTHLAATTARRTQREHDLAACAAVREALGPDVPLMLDPFHYYSRLEALQLAKGSRRSSTSVDGGADGRAQYVELRLVVRADRAADLWTETVEGKMFSRAEWIKAVPATCFARASATWAASLRWSRSPTWQKRSV